MTCTKCGSSNVNVQMVSESQLKNKHHSILVVYWLVVETIIMDMLNYAYDICKIIWT